MNRIFILPFLLMSLLLFTACQKADDNGELGGFWKLMSVETFATGSLNDYSKKSYFLAVQLDLMQFRTFEVNYARFQHRGDSLHVQMIGDKLPGNLLSTFGFEAAEQSFFVERLSDNRLVLRTLLSRLTFKKF